jgi:hypothetical protein
MTGALSGLSETPAARMLESVPQACAGGRAREFAGRGVRA